MPVVAALQDSLPGNHSARMDPSLDTRAPLAMRRADCSEHTVACGAIPARRVMPRDIDLSTIETVRF